MTDIDWDVVIVGGGPAGLSTALTLVRARRRVLVLDAGLPRNRFTTHMHGLLGRDGTSPRRLAADGRHEIEGYGGVFRETVVRDVRPVPGGFVVTDTTGTRTTARRLVVATGLRDELPDVDGLSDHWGRGVAVCPYCDAYEVRDGRIGVLATGPGSPHQAQLLRQWTDRVTYLTDTQEPPEGDDAAALAARGIAIASGSVRKVTGDGERVTGVELDDGRFVELDAVFTMPRFVPADDLLGRLGARSTEGPMGPVVDVDDFGRTSVDGVWAVGNVVNLAANVPMSIGAGAAAAGFVNHDLVVEDVEQALNEARVNT